MKVSKVKYRVIYGDIDAMGITYYGNYFRWFEIGRTEFLRELGLCYREVERGGYILPVTETFCKYVSPAYYDTVVTIETKLAWLKKASLRFNYRILGEEDSLELANGYTARACLDRDRRVVRIPSFLLDKLEKSGFSRIEPRQIGGGISFLLCPIRLGWGGRFKMV